jgi:hypothetical protein
LILAYCVIVCSFNADWHWIFRCLHRRMTGDVRPAGSNPIVSVSSGWKGLRPEPAQPKNSDQAIRG